MSENEESNVFFIDISEDLLLEQIHFLTIQKALEDNTNLNEFITSIIIRRDNLNIDNFSSAIKVKKTKDLENFSYYRYNISTKIEEYTKDEIGITTLFVAISVLEDYKKVINIH